MNKYEINQAETNKNNEVDFLIKEIFREILYLENLDLDLDIGKLYNSLMNIKDITLFPDYKRLQNLLKIKYLLEDYQYSINSLIRKEWALLEMKT